MNQNERRNYLIRYLILENDEYSNIQIPANTNETEQKNLLRALINVRLPAKISKEFLKVQDEYLTEETKNKGITKIQDLEPIQKGIYLWQGDISTLECDAIVNAANSGMTGCYVPNHKCIDNCIHTFAGIQLRLECNSLMQKQGFLEPTGKAKITKAYNLPCKYILHTVGPIITGKVSKNDEELLKSCYNSCLELANQNNLESIAFCCISTGEFHFPNEKAAKIAIQTVKEFLNENSNNSSIKKVIFNVFKDEDKKIYEQLLQSN